jgi:hypothetical protein
MEGQTLSVKGRPGEYIFVIGVWAFEKVRLQILNIVVGIDLLV